MIVFYYVIFEEMLKSGQYNVPTSPLWILKSEKVFHKGKYFLKVYIHQNTSILSQLKGIAFELKHSNSISKLECYEFQKVERYQDENIFGCLLELPAEYNGSDYSVNISSYFLNNEEIFLDLNNLTKIQLNADQLESMKNSFLRSQIPNYSFFPMINEDYWQCKCGKINPSHMDKCSNCFTEFNDIGKIINIGLMETFYYHYIKKNPFVIDTEKDVESNLDIYCKKLSNFGIPTYRILTDIKTNDFLNQYLNAHPFVLQPKFNAIENINKYAEMIEKYGLNRSEIVERFDEEIMDKQIRDINFNEKRSKTKKRRVTVVTISLLIVFLFVYLFGFKLIQYGIAYNNYKSRNYSASISNFERLGNFMDSKNLKNDSMYLNAIMVYDTDPNGSITALDNLRTINFKDSEKLFSGYVYLIAEEQFLEKNYRNALTYYYIIPNYLDVKEKINESNFQLGIEYFLSKNYPEAIKFMLVPSYEKYRDSIDKLNEYRYLYGKQLMVTGDVSSAEFQFRQISSYKDSKELRKSIYRNYVLGNIIRINKIELVNGDWGHRVFRMNLTNLTKINYETIGIAFLIYDSNGNLINDPENGQNGSIDMFFSDIVKANSTLSILQSRIFDFSGYRTFIPYVHYYETENGTSWINPFDSYIRSLTYNELKELIS